MNRDDATKSDQLSMEDHLRRGRLLRGQAAYEVYASLSRQVRALFDRCEASERPRAQLYVDGGKGDKRP